MLKKEWQALWKNKFLMVVLIAIITIPTIYTSIFLGSMWDPYGEVENLPVAVVNNDKAADYDGKTMEVGKELVDKLKEEQSLAFDYVDAKTAAAGLEDGSYYMVITIPEDFSYNATTLMDENPKTMELKYETNPGTNYIASKMSESAINKIRTSVAEKVTKEYAETIFDQLGEIADGFNDAVDGTDKLLDGTDKLSDGNSKIEENLNTLADSSLVFKDGADELKVGLKTYTDGVAAVNDGASQLKDGIGTLADGTGALTEGASQLSDGTSQLKDGTSSLKDGTSQLKSGSSTLASGVSTYTSAVGQIYAGATTLQSNNKALNDGVSTLASGVSTLKSGSAAILSGLNEMSGQLDKGLSKEKVALLNQLTAGLDTADTQMKQADAMLQSLDTAALTNQVDTLTTGVSSIQAGAKATSAYVAGVGSDVDEAVESIKKSAGFDKLSDEEQQEIIEAVTGIKSSANYQSAKGYAEKVADGASEMKTALDNSDLSAVGQIGALKDGIHSLVSNDVFGNSKTAIATQLASLQSIQDALDRTGKTPDTMGLIQGMSAVDEGLTQVETGLTGKGGLQEGVKTYTEGVATLNSALNQLDGNSEALVSGATQLNKGASQLDTGAAELNTGAAKLDAGVVTMVSKLPALTAGIDKLQKGSSDLYAGTNKLVANNSTILDGMGQLSDGAAKISDGSTKLAEASGTLGEGLEKVADGTTELHDALKEGADKVKDSTDVADDDTYEMLATPVETANTELTSVANNGSAMAAYMMSVGLWVGCLAFSIMYPLADPAGKIKNGLSWWFSKASIAGIIAGAQAVVMVFALKGILGFSPAYLGKTVLIAVLASYAFMSIFYLGNILLGKVGSFILLIFMVLQLGGSAGTYPIELSNSFFQAINPYMPFTYSVNAFRATIASGQSITPAIVVFSSIFVVATALTIMVFHFKAKRAVANEATMEAEAVLN